MERDDDDDDPKHSNKAGAEVSNRPESTQESVVGGETDCRRADGPQPPDSLGHIACSAACLFSGQRPLKVYFAQSCSTG